MVTVKRSIQKLQHLINNSEVSCEAGLVISEVIEDLRGLYGHSPEFTQELVELSKVPNTNAAVKAVLDKTNT